MSDDFAFDLNEETLQIMIKKKEEAGFGNKSWNEWFNEIFKSKNDKQAKTIIEETLQKVHFEQYYDMWVKNFSLNLIEIWNGHSAKEFLQRDNKGINKYSIVIGGGPSLKTHDHLKMLKQSNFQGNIVCTDGILIDVLKAGITPELFPNFYVVTIDSMDEIYEHYDDAIIDKYGTKINGIFSTTISPMVYARTKKSKITPYWIHTLFDYDKGKSSFNYISGAIIRAKNHVNGLPAIQTGGNVGTSAWVTSWSILRSTNVVLIGFDQGYSPDTPLEEIGYGHHKFPTGMIIKPELLEKAYPVIYNPDFNCYVRQDPMFQYYCNALKEFISRMGNKVTTINATEGGGLFGNGIIPMKLYDFLKTVS